MQSEQGARPRSNAKCCLCTRILLKHSSISDALWDFSVYILKHPWLLLSWKQTIPSPARLCPEGFPGPCKPHRLCSTVLALLTQGLGAATHWL